MKKLKLSFRKHGKVELRHIIWDVRDKKVEKIAKSVFKSTINQMLKSPAKLIEHAIHIEAFRSQNDLRQYEIELAAGGPTIYLIIGDIVNEFRFFWWPNRVIILLEGHHVFEEAIESLRNILDEHYTG